MFVVLRNYEIQNDQFFSYRFRIWDFYICILHMLIEGIICCAMACNEMPSCVMYFIHEGFNTVHFFVSVSFYFSSQISESDFLYRVGADFNCNILFSILLKIDLTNFLKIFLIDLDWNNDVFPILASVTSHFNPWDEMRWDW